MATETLITPVILSGGSGTRLWPLSTPEKPKQFLDLLGPLSMFQLTLQRCTDSGLYRQPIVVGAAGHTEIMSKQLQDIGSSPAAVILEPCARNTAPAIALAALAAGNPTDLLLVMPSDHVIKNITAFQKAVRQSVPVAQSRWLVTFGIKPTGPATGYGYIRQGDPVVGSEKSRAAVEFVEKPDRRRAEQMVVDGDYCWNAGIFLFRADAYLAAMEEHAPAMLEACRAAMTEKRMESELLYPAPDAFAAAPSGSIDYAIMERAGNIAVTPVNPGWSDVGSWDSLFDISDKDRDSNALFGRAEAINSRGNLIHSREIEVCALCVENLIIVTHGNRVVVLPRGQSQDIKDLVQRLEEKD